MKLALTLAVALALSLPASVSALTLMDPSVHQQAVVNASLLPFPSGYVEVSTSSCPGEEWAAGCFVAPREIFVNHDDFTLLHELGHWVLEEGPAAQRGAVEQALGLSGPWTGGLTVSVGESHQLHISPQEVAADAFAACAQSTTAPVATPYGWAPSQTRYARACRTFSPNWPSGTWMHSMPPKLLRMRLRHPRPRCRGCHLYERAN